jgi:dTMP kinase
VGRLIVIEGLDGSGKRTLAESMAATARERGQRVVTLAFPRYGVGVHADLVKDALYGRLGDVSDSVYGMALLFALDRRDALPEIRAALETHDVLLLDRYISANAAYAAARLGAPETANDLPSWVRDLEVTRFGLPEPDLQILLATDPGTAAQRARMRAQSQSERALDRFEADAALQRRTSAMYAALAAQGYLSSWQVVQPGPDGHVAILPGLMDGVD